MDDATRMALQAAAATLLGFLWQWMRGPKSVPDWLSWLGFGLAAAALYVWQAPTVSQQDWRVTGLGLYVFVMAARGSASTAGDIKIAPKANSL